MCAFLINPFVFSTAAGYPNTYSMLLTRTTSSATMDLLKINNKSNAIDTAMRDTTPNFSLSVWFKVNTANNGTSRVLFSKYEDFGGRDRNFFIYFNGNGSLWLYGQYNSSSVSLDATTNAKFTAATWVHLTFVYDSSQTVGSNIAKLYIDGALVTSYASQTVSTTNKFFNNQTTESSRANVAFGVRYYGGSAGLAQENFGGNLDEATFWDKSLSSTEVSEIYNSGDAYNISGMTSYSSNCLAWWRNGDFPTDNWDGSNWNIINVKATASTDLLSANLVEADRVADVP